MCNSLTAEIKAALRPTGQGATLLVTIGNALRSDDGVGPYIAARLQTPPPGYCLLDAGDRPESLLHPELEAKPAKIIILDAADFHGRPGEIRLIPPELIPEQALSTHAFPLNIAVRLLQEDTGALVHVVGIQPRQAGLGEGLSPEVRRAAELIILAVQEAGRA